MLRLFRYVFLALAALGFANAGALAQAAAREPAPVVVASILPLHSLLANVMAGVGTPLLLMRPGTSPHNYVMRPSEEAMLSRADLIFWLGESGERVLLKPLETLTPGRTRRMVALLDLPSIQPLLLRPVGPWSGEAKPAADRASYLTDPHIWLDPEIAGKIVAAMVTELSRIDPRHASEYAANGGNTLARLARLDQALRWQLDPVRAVPYIVYHEAFQYLEQRYGLNNVGSVSDTSDLQPGARLIGEMKETIVRRQVRCVFIEPQFSPSLVPVLVGGTAARVAVTDPEGAAIAPGPEAYFQLMAGLGNSLASCLGAR